MKTIPSLLKEFDLEAQNTRKMLSIVPNDRYGWKPHPKSMSVGELVSHIGEIPGWVALVLTTEDLDFATHPQPPQVTNTRELLEYFEESYATGKSQLEKSTENDLLPNWTMRNGDTIFSVDSKHDVIRMCFSQIVHHRAQLGVYLRLLNIPIPGSYGPSADELEAHANFERAEVN